MNFSNLDDEEEEEDIDTLLKLEKRKMTWYFPLDNIMTEGNNNCIVAYPKDGTSELLEELFLDFLKGDTSSIFFHHLKGLENVFGAST